MTVRFIAIALFSAILFVCPLKGLTQPGALGTNNLVSAGFNCSALNDLGSFRQVRLQAGVSANPTWEFPSSCGYPGDVWRPYASGTSAIAFNTVIAPVGGTGSALYNSSNGGASGTCAAVVSGRYYTFNITENSAGQNNYMEVLQTNYNPKTISSVSSAPYQYAGHSITIVTGATPSSGEYFYVRYSVDGYLTSSLAQFSFSVNTGTATIPALPAGSNVSYYVYSSNKTIGQINLDVLSHGQISHDLATLRLAAGGSYSLPAQPIIVTSTAGTNSAIYTGYGTLQAAFASIQPAVLHGGSVYVAIAGNTTETGTAAISVPAGVSLLTIRTTGVYSISGSLNAPLVHISGGTQISVVGTTPSSSSNNLTFTNTGSSGESLVINGVTNFSIDHVNLYAANNTGAVVEFRGASSNISMDGCQISDSSSNPRFGIATENSASITTLSLSNNAISDFFHPSSTSGGIYITQPIGNAIIAGNLMFQSTTRTLSSSVSHYGIYYRVSSASSTPTVDSNLIGYANTALTGTTTYVLNGGYFYPIFIQNNTSLGINFSSNAVKKTHITTTTSSTRRAPSFAAFTIRGGSLQSIMSNELGDDDSGDNLFIECNGTDAAHIYGLYCDSLTEVSMQGNAFRGITISANNTLDSLISSMAYFERISEVAAINNFFGQVPSFNSTITSGGSSFTGVHDFSVMRYHYVSDVQLSSNYLRRISINSPSQAGTSSAALVIVEAPTYNYSDPFYSGYPALQPLNYSITGCQIDNISTTGSGVLSDLLVRNVKGSGFLDADASASISFSSNIIQSHIIQNATADFRSFLISNSRVLSAQMSLNGFGINPGPTVFIYPINTTVAHSGQLGYFSLSNNSFSGNINLETNAFYGAQTSAGSTSNFEGFKVEGRTNAIAINYNSFFNKAISNSSDVQIISIDCTSASSCSLNVNSNQYSAGTESASTHFYFLNSKINAPTTTSTINNNTFSNFTFNATVDGGIIRLKHKAGIHTAYNNTFNSITNAGNGDFTVMSALDFEGNISVADQYNFTNNTLSNITANGPLKGLYSKAGQHCSFNENALTYFTSTSRLTGIELESPLMLASVEKNKIGGLISTSSNDTLVGLSTNCSFSAIQNNLIGAMTSSSNTLDNCIRGIQTGAQSTGADILHNTVFLNATPGPANFGSSALFVYNASGLRLQNNILQNTSGTTGSGKAVAFRRASSSLTGFVASSGNNLFSVGSTSIYRHLHFDGANTHNSIATLKSFFSPAEQFSIEELASFISTTPSAASFLHINSSIPTHVESGGALIGVVSDYDSNSARVGPYPLSGQLNGGGDAPDIGADEGDFLPVLDVTLPSISFSPLSSMCYTTLFSLNNVSITDAGGLPHNPTLGSSANRPQIYFRKNSDAWHHVPGTLASGDEFASTWDFSFSGADMGGVAEGDVISYFIIAQDNATIPNVNLVSGTGWAAADVNTIGTYPLSTLTFELFYQLDGSYNVGAGGDFISLAEAANVYNHACLLGSVDFVLTDIIYGNSETAVFTENPTASESTLLTIRPANGVSTIIQSESGAKQLIIFRGADYITLDGSNNSVTNTECPNNTASRNLTLSLPYNSDYSAVISIQSIGSNSAHHITIKNCNINGHSKYITSFGIHSGGDEDISTNSLGYQNDFNTFENNQIHSVQIGIYTSGFNNDIKNNHTRIVLNDIDGVENLGVRDVGIMALSEHNLEVSSNTIFAMEDATDPNQITAGLLLGEYQNFLLYDVPSDRSVTDVEVTKNKISSIYNESGSSVVGIRINPGETGACIVANNIISHIGGTPTYENAIAGISVRANPYCTMRILHNTIDLSNEDYSLAFSDGRMGCLIATNVDAGKLEVQNNIFKMRAVQTYYPLEFESFAIGLATSDFNYFVSDYNALYAELDPVWNLDHFIVTGGLFGGTNHATLPDWQTISGFDTHSHFINVPFVGSLDFSPNGALVISEEINNAGTPSLFVSDDFECTSRGATPDIGAIEFDMQQCTIAGTAGSLTALATSVCVNDSTSIFSSGYSQYYGVSYEWQSAPLFLDVWTNLGQHDPQSFNTGPITQTKRFRLLLTCANSGFTSYSLSPMTISALSAPTVTVPADKLLCETALSTTLTATSSSYTNDWWTLPDGSQQFAQTVVIASPDSNDEGLYTYRSQGSNGCVGVGHTRLYIDPVQEPITLSADDNHVCVPQTATLTNSGGQTLTDRTFYTTQHDLEIVDNPTSPRFSTISTTSMPTGAHITAMHVSLDIQHMMNDQLIINLIGPNNSIINLINQSTDGGTDLTDLIISTTSVNTISSGSSPYTGSFLPDLALGVGPTGFTSNETDFAAFTSTPSGNYTLVIQDTESPAGGVLYSWSIRFEYSVDPIFTWHSGNNITPTDNYSAEVGGGLANYVSKTTNAGGCITYSNPIQVSVDYPFIPMAFISPMQSTTLCGSNNTVMLLSATNSPSGSITVNWFLNGNQIHTGNSYTGTSWNNDDEVYITVQYDNECVVGESLVISDTTSFIVNNLAWWYNDNDHDGFPAGTGVESCTQPVGYNVTSAALVSTTIDCNDNDEDVNPGADEWCNGADDNCAGGIDEGLGTIAYYLDADGDGYGAGTAVIACTQPVGYVLNNSDCNDALAAVNPAATEICDGINNDCDAFIDEVCAPSNDERNAALPTFPTAYGVSGCQTVSGTLAAATVSAEATTTAVTGEDVWYYFEAQEGGVNIAVTSSVNNLLLELQTEAGAFVASENVQSTIGNETLNYPSLTAGETYLLCVRNYNSAQGAGGPFSICLKTLRATGCASPTSVGLCEQYKLNFTGASQYIWHFGTGITHTGPYSAPPALPASTRVVLSTVDGIQYGQTYSPVWADAVYTLTDGAGNTEIITVPGISTCSLTVPAHPDPDVRLTDQNIIPSQPTTKPVNSFIAADPYICAVSGYDWEFRKVDLSGNPVDLTTHVYNSPTASRFVRLNSAVVPGIQAGDRYRVRIRPRFLYIGNVVETAGEWGSDYQYVRATPLAGMSTEAVDLAYDLVLWEKELAGESFADIYPNPNKGDRMMLNFVNQESGFTSVKIFDATGKQIWGGQYATEAGVFSTEISPENALVPGLYLVEIILNNSELVSKKLVVQ